MCKYIGTIICKHLAIFVQVSCKYLLNSLASIYCKINMQVSYLYLVPFLAHLLARCARKWPNYVQDSKMSASCARLYIHTATLLARTRIASSCKVTQVYSTWDGTFLRELCHDYIMANFYVTSALIHSWHAFTLLSTHVKASHEQSQARILYGELLRDSECPLTSRKTSPYIATTPPRFCANSKLTFDLT